MKTIAIIGAQGHLGQKLSRRISEIATNTPLLLTSDKTSTATLAAKADILVLVVRTEQMETILSEIASVLKLEASIISFVGRFPLATIAGTTQRSVMRVMADPFWNMCAYVRNGDVDGEVRDLLTKFTKTTPTELATDAELDRYTYLLAHLFAVLLLKRLGQLKKPDTHLEFLAEAFSSLGRLVTVQEFEHFDLGTDPQESLKTIMTPGGLTEKVVALLKNGAQPEEIQKHFVNL